MPKFIKNRSKWRPRALQRHPKTDSENNSFPNIPPGVFFLDFGRHLGDLGCHLVPSWAPRGSQNQVFWHQDAPKWQKNASRMRHHKKYEFSIEFLSENMRFWRCWTLPNALYISISVVFADYDKFENFMKIYAQMDPKSHPKIDLWAIRGPTFEVFGSVLRNAIFDEFWDVQEVD